MYCWIFLLMILMETNVNKTANDLNRLIEVIVLSLLYFKVFGFL